MEIGKSNKQLSQIILYILKQANYMKIFWNYCTVIELLVKVNLQEELIGHIIQYIGIM